MHDQSLCWGWLGVRARDVVRVVAIGQIWDQHGHNFLHICGVFDIENMDFL